MKPATRLISAVYGEPRAGEPLLPPPVFGATYPHSGDPATGTTYGRTSNASWTAYERALGELEGGEALVFASGLAALAAVCFSTLRAGDVLVMPADGYFGARALAQQHLAALGIDVRLAATADWLESDALTGARLVLVESPSNPLLDVCDLRAVIARAHAAGALVAVDNTTATVYGQQPLPLGADFSVSSDTKALSGHSDLLLGHVAVRDGDLLARLADWRAHGGAIAGPMETWLAHRSLATLAVRLERQCASAVIIAEALRRHPAVVGCRYPGLPDDPAHAQAAAQMSSYGPVLNFTLEGREAAERWLSAVRLVVPATSFGGVHTTAERRARWGGDEVPEGFIRLSVGLEDPEDLVDDITAAIA